MQVCRPVSLMVGGSDDFLFNGPKITGQIEVATRFGPNGYRFKLAPTADETFIINDEARYYEGSTSGWWEMGSGQTMPELLRDKDRESTLEECKFSMS
ncbi:MAG: hypothetical protein JRI32_03330 [Deltaproteobacteria bacterium]|nr:hypothetical protein [Deltaproteobacteria bacterium]